MIRLRRALLTDAKALALLAERTFRATFEPWNDPEDMNAHCASAYGEGVQAKELSDPLVTTIVCDFEGSLVAYGQLRWSPAPRCVVAERPAEIHRLYVEQAFHGQGVASRLMTELLACARAGGADRIWLGVWEHNARARAFYAKFGFMEVGEHVFRLGSDDQRDLVLVRDLAA